MRRFPMGLFRDVKLVASGAATIDDLFVATKSLNADGSATLEISGTVNNYAEQDVTANLDLEDLARQLCRSQRRLCRAKR